MTQDWNEIMANQAEDSRAAADVWTSGGLSGADVEVRADGQAGAGTAGRLGEAGVDRRSWAPVLGGGLPNTQREVVVSVRGIHPNTREDVVINYLQKFGKVFTSKVVYGVYSD